MIYSIEEIIVFVFRIINFFVIVGLIIYVFKRYLLKIILAQIEEKKALIHGLISTDRMLIRQRNAMSRKIAEDQEDQSCLKEKLMRWRAAIDENKAQLYDIREKRRAFFEELITKQAGKNQEAVLARKLLPSIVDETRALLVKEYADQKEQEEFMGRLIKFMHGDKK